MTATMTCEICGKPIRCGRYCPPPKGAVRSKCGQVAKRAWEKARRAAAKAEEPATICVICGKPMEQQPGSGPRRRTCKPLPGEKQSACERENHNRLCRRNRAIEKSVKLADKYGLGPDKPMFTPWEKKPKVPVFSDREQIVIERDSEERYWDRAFTDDSRLRAIYFRGAAI